MPREFKVVGKITEDTRVLGSTHGQVQQAVEAGFQEQFRLQEESQANRVLYAQVARAVAVLETQSQKVARAGSVGGFVPRALSVSGGAARNVRIAATRGLDALFNGSVLSQAYENAIKKTFVEKVVKEQLEAGMKVNVVVSNGQLVMRTANEQAPAPAERRRVGERENSR